MNCKFRRTSDKGAVVSLNHPRVFLSTGGLQSNKSGSLCWEGSTFLAASGMNVAWLKEEKLRGWEAWVPVIYSFRTNCPYVSDLKGQPFYYISRRWVRNSCQRSGGNSSLPCDKDWSPWCIPLAGRPKGPRVASLTCLRLWWSKLEDWGRPRLPTRLSVHCLSAVVVSRQSDFKYGGSGLPGRTLPPPQKKGQSAEKWKLLVP